MKQEHTPEPWDLLSTGVRWAVTHNTAERADVCRCQRAANAIRIVSCVNNCAGLNPEGIPDLFDALTALTNTTKAWHGTEAIYSSEAHAPIRKAYDFARAALKKVKG